MTTRERLDLDGLPLNSGSFREYLGDLSPSLWLPLGSSNGLTDLSGNGRNGTANGGLTVGGGAGMLTGVSDTSTDLDGSNDYISTTYNPFVNGTVRTFMGLAKRDTNASNDMLIAGPNATSVYLDLESGTQNVRWKADLSSGSTKSWTAAWPGNGQTVFWAIVFNEPANTVSLYINGALVETKADTDQFNAAAGNLMIGARLSGSDPFDGSMQHVAVVEGALSAAQVKALYQIGVANWGYIIQGLNIGPPSKRLLWQARKDGDALGDVPGHERRTVTARLRVPGASDKDDALARIGSLVDKLQKAELTEGGIDAIWQPTGGTFTGTLKVLAAEITELPIEMTGDNTGWFIEHPVAEIRLDCKPFLYGAEVTETTVTNTDPMQFVTIVNVTGDVPAEGRLIVSDAATQARDHVEWGVESGTTAQTATDLLLDSDDLTITGYAGTGTTRSGAYDPGGAGSSVARLVTSPTWVALASTGNQTHVGTYRVKARVYSTTADATARLSWRAGDAAHVSNPQSLSPLANQWSELDLGIIRIPETELGTQRWEGRVEVKADTAGANFDLDALWLIPAERYGKARATINASTPTVFSARDEFDQTAGALTGKTLPVGGGNWAGAGDADDFSVASSTAQRTALSDASGFATGRFAIAPPTALTNTAVRVSFRVSGVDAGSFQGVIARYTNVSNALAVYVDFDGTNRIVAVVKQVAGVTTTLATTEELAWSRSSTDWETVQLLVTATGVVFGWHNTGRTVVGEPILRAQDSVLATGGTLASGQAGFYDSWTSGTASTRSFDDFTMWVPALDRVIHSGQSLEVRSEDTLREDSTGTYWGRPPVYRGSRFFIPPAGDSANTARIVVKTRRGDVDLFADDQIADSTSVAVAYTPRYLAVPRS